MILSIGFAHAINKATATVIRGFRFEGGAPTRYEKTKVIEIIIRRAIHKKASEKSMKPNLPSASGKLRTQTTNRMDIIGVLEIAFICFL